MSFYKHYKPIPIEDEHTELDSIIYWSQVESKSDPRNDRHTVRIVPIRCACGEMRYIDVNDVNRYRCRGLCLVCASRLTTRRGPTHADWKGGRYINLDGYSMISRGALTPEQLKLVSSMIPRTRPYIPEHRLVMAEYLNRPLKTNEHVHHIDGRKTHNVIENLQLVSPSDHAYVELVKAREELKRLYKILDDHHIPY